MYGVNQITGKLITTYTKTAKLTEINRQIHSNIYLQMVGEF